ncbi:MAG: DUF927 domain-containing protein [Halothiobacillaceae bacterium]|nr:DUF927 domain-containing protein [Halothiobacillaceae bacterium]
MSAVEIARRRVDDHLAAQAEPIEPGPMAPDGWELTDKGVFEVKPGKDGEPDRRDAVCGRLWVVGLTTGAAGDWGRLIAFEDHDGRERQLAIPAARLHEDPAILARELANMGLAIIPGKERRLLAYLASHRPALRIPSAPRLGWMNRRDGGLAFVFPDRVLTADGNARVVHQPERYSPTASTVHASGTLEDWRREVGEHIAGSDALLFVACAGLAAPWLWLADGDSFIVHLWGRTSRGKTTLAQVGASIWGCGVDPAEAPALSFVRRWNTTGNGLEGLAEAHTDLPLCLDELGAGQHRDMAPLIYQLAGGQGKTAMSADRQLKAPRAWRTIALSTGEMSLEGKLSEHGPVKGGLLHRALDVEVSDIAAHLTEGARAAFVQGIKRACAVNYGTAGPAVLKSILATYPDAQTARAAVREYLDDAAAELTSPHHAPEQARAMRRFALVAWAGIFAASHGVLPTTPDRVWDAVQAIAGRWGGDTTGTDGERILEAVRAFIIKNGARFQDVTSSIKPAPLYGYRDASLGRWMITKEALLEAAPGHDIVTIARAIKEAWHLFTNDSKLTVKCTVPDGSRPRLYVVKDSIFDDEAPKPGGQGGQGGRGASECTFQAANQSTGAGGQVGSEAGNLPTCPPNATGTWAGANPHSTLACPPAHPAHLENRDASNDEAEL